MSKEQHHRLLLQYFSPSTPTEEKKGIFDELIGLGETKQSLEKLQRYWELTGQLTPDWQPHVAAGWEKLSSQVKEEATPVIPINRSRSLFLKVAAAVIPLLIIGTYLLFFRGNSYTEIQTADNLEEIILPDQSKVWLNRNSRLWYEEFTDDRRVVNLSGEAYFEVTHDPNKPFAVNAEQITTTVLGTAFNIKATKGESAHTVTLIEGKVRVVAKANEPTILTPGMQAIYNKASGKLYQVGQKDENVLSWKRRRLVFNNLPVDQVFDQLESYFNIELKVKNNDILNCAFTGQFEDPEIDEVVDVLQQVLTIEIVSNRAGAFEISGKGCE